MKKKIAIIGSSQYWSKMQQHLVGLRKLGHEATLPCLDSHICPGKSDGELDVCVINRKRIEEADEVHLFWDGRSQGVIFDLGMVFALRKKLKIVYLEPKTFVGVIRKWEKEGLNMTREN